MRRLQCSTFNIKDVTRITGRRAEERLGACQLGRRLCVPTIAGPIPSRLGRFDFPGAQTEQHGGGLVDRTVMGGRKASNKRKIDGRIVGSESVILFESRTKL